MSFARAAVLSTLFPLVSFAASSAGPCPLDASQTVTGSLTAYIGPGPGLPDNYTRAQTFVVGTDGMLDAVEVYLTGNSPLLQGALVADVRPATAGGAPLGDSSVLGTITLQQVETNGAKTQLDFSGQNIQVQAGQQLAVVLSSAIDTIGWYGANSDPYASGDLYWRTDANPTVWQHDVGRDLYFQVSICTGPTAVGDASWGRVKASYAE